jgi:hypothetical protein
MNPNPEMEGAGAEECDDKNLPGKSCCTNLLEFMEKVTSAVDEGVHYDVILDLAEGFR